MRIQLVPRFYSMHFTSHEPSKAMLNMGDYRLMLYLNENFEMKMCEISDAFLQYDGGKFRIPTNLISHFLQKNRVFHILYRSALYLTVASVPAICCSLSVWKKECAQFKFEWPWDYYCVLYAIRFGPLYLNVSNHGQTILKFYDTAAAYRYDNSRVSNFLTSINIFLKI